jgi:cytochrome c553
VQPATPGLLGLPRDYLNAQLGGWRTGNRRALAPDCMAEVAKALAPDDISAVSQWLAAQAVPLSAKAVEALPSPASKPCGGGVR